MFYSLVTMPTPASVISSTTEWSGPFFTEFLAYAWIPVGILVGVLLLKFLVRAVRNGAKNFASGRRGRRMGRRR